MESYDVDQTYLCFIVLKIGNLLLSFIPLQSSNNICSKFKYAKVAKINPYCVI